MLSISILAAILAFFIDTHSAIMYVRGVLKGFVHPHLFSWAVWAVLMLTGGAICWSQSAWAGAVALFICGSLATIISFLALRYGTRYATRGDWISFVCALAALPLWGVTKDPLPAAIIITLINMASYYPTFRKSWAAPYGESLQCFAMFACAGALRVVATSPLTLVSGLYPSSMAALNVVMVLMLSIRRQVVRRAKAHPKA